MIKNKFKIIILVALLLSSSLIGDDSKMYYNANSLVAIEGGYSRINFELNDATTYSKKGTDLYNIGLKIGAETQDYRVFLSANYFNNQSNDYDYIATYGATFEYKFNISHETNMFIGVNGGIANMKFTLAGENKFRTISSPYLGGDVGFNFATSERTDFEVGVRYLNIQASNIKNAKEYILNDMLGYYMSFIFKFNID